MGPVPGRALLSQWLAGAQEHSKGDAKILPPGADGFLAVALGAHAQVLRGQVVSSLAEGKAFSPRCEGGGQGLEYRLGS